jgi:threonine dehydrogenase-like Zn-dependent dehydrogenase
MYVAGDVRIENIPDALVVITRVAICGSDLWLYKNIQTIETSRRMGHEFIGIVEAVESSIGLEVSTTFQMATAQ